MIENRPMATNEPEIAPKNKNSVVFDIIIVK